MAIIQARDITIFKGMRFGPMTISGIHSSFHNENESEDDANLTLPALQQRIHILSNDDYVKSRRYSNLDILGVNRRALYCLTDRSVEELVKKTDIPVEGGDFNFDKAEVTICRSLEGSKPKDSNKTDNPYTIPIHRDLIERLRLLCIKRNPGDIVFRYKGKPWGETTLRKKCNEAREKAGLKYQLYKGVKHACLSELADQTGQIRNVSKFAGHTNTSTTEKYTERVDIEKLREMQSLITIPDDL